MKRPVESGRAVPVFFALFFSIFGFIGLAMLFFLWSQRSGEFGAPPLIFRWVGSFIALAFILMGFGVPVMLLRQKAEKLESLREVESGTDPATPPAVGYKCPGCGAGLGQSEVSPSGDVKCGYCQKWWNIHHASVR